MTHVKPPSFLLGATLLFWGWQTEFLIVGAFLALLIEGKSFTRARWDFGEEDFSRIWTLCALVLLAATLYAFTATESASDLLSFLQNPNFFTQRRAGNSSARAIASLMQWQPMIFFPFVAAAAYSTREGVPLRTISLILQRRWKKAKRLGQPPPPSPSVGVEYPYFALCLFSTSIQNNEGTAFFWGLCALVAYGLWPFRSRRFGWPVYAGALAVAVAMGYFGQRGAAEVQQYIGSLNPQWFTRYARRGFDPRQTQTLIGNVGRVKLSNSIVVRLETEGAARPPNLLREASYRVFERRVWSSGNTRTNEFETMPSETNETTWVMLPNKPASQKVNIACYLPGGNALLPLPRGTTRMEQLPAFLLQTNVLGAVLAEGPGLVIFDALYGPGATIDSPPGDIDVSSIPRREVRALNETITEAGLRGHPFDETLRRLTYYFQTNFTYSTWQAGAPKTDSEYSPLGDFLRQTRQGHCEYFATATVLLLRQLGFPARYAVGYAVHEKTDENSYIVRYRDAHAWTLVWNNGRWQDLDTTPSSWFEAENRNRSRFQSVSDFFSRIGFEFSKIRWGQSHFRQYLLWSLVPVVGLLILQIVIRSRRKRRGGKPGKTSVAHTWPGLDSEFYNLERSLRKHGYGRRKAEPFSDWIDRVVNDGRFLPLKPQLERALRLHYRYRFDPIGLSSAERQDLEVQVRECARELYKRPRAPVAV